MDTADDPPRSPLRSRTSGLRRFAGLPWRITSKIFVYGRRLAVRIGVWRLLIAAAVLVALAGAGIYALRYKSPQQKIELAEANYDQAMAARAYPFASGMMRLALSINENEPRFWLKLGRSELAAGSFQGALEGFSRVLDYDPGNIEALQAVAELSIAGGNAEDAKEYVAQLLRLAPGDVRGSIANIAIATRERRFADAERQIAVLLARGVSTDDLFVLQARARLAQQDLKGAIAILETRDKATPGSPTILRELVGYYSQANDAPGLRRTRARLIALDPTNVGFQISGAEDLASQGRGDEAKVAIDQIQGKAPNDPDVQLQVIDYWRRTGGVPAAIDAARRAGESGGPATRIASAQRLIDLGRPGEALALIEPITAQLGSRNSSGATTAWTVQGNALFALGRLDEARAIADRLLAYDPTNNRALRLRTRLGIAQKRLETALIDAQLLVANQPGTLEPMLLLAQVQALRNDRALADQAYARARSAFPDSVSAVRQSVAYLYGQGRRDEAGEVLRDFLKSHFSTPQARVLVIEICRRTPLPACDRPVL